MARESRLVYRDFGPRISSPFQTLVTLVDIWHGCRIYRQGKERWAVQALAVMVMVMVNEFLWAEEVFADDLR